MSKRTIYIAVAAVLALAFIVFGIFLLVKPSSPAEKEVAPREFSPFPRLEEVVPEEAPIFELPSEVFPIEEVALPTGKQNLIQLVKFGVAGAGFIETEVWVNPEEAGVEIFDFTKYPNFKTGSSGEGVKNLQIVLNRFIEKQNENKPEEERVGLLPEGTNFVDLVKDAVVLFQKAQGLKADGSVGPKTKLALNEFQKPETTTVAILRFAAKNDGRVFETDLNKLETEQITGPTIPRLAEAFFGANDSVLLRYSRDGGVSSFLGRLTAVGGGIKELPGSFLTNNIQTVALSPDNKNLLYLAPAALGAGVNGSVGFTLSFEDKVADKLFDSAFSEWLAQWTEKGAYLLTKPSFTFGGFLYNFDSKTKTLDKILGGINGLTALVSPNGQKVLASGSINGGITTDLYDVPGRTFSGLGLKTLPEKCAFNKNSARIYCAVPKNIPSGDYPDDWYQGSVSFNDSIWEINLETLATNIINDLSLESEQAVDAINLSVDSAEQNLVFINKIDNTLWLLKLE